MVELEPKDLHWLVDDDPSQDLCAHGGVYLKINDAVISEGSDSEWTVSAASYYLLKTAWSDHKPGLDNQLIPCCGHSMVKTDDVEDGLVIIGCPNGIDWEIKHVADNVIHRFDDGTTQAVTEDEWRLAVSAFSRQVLDFFVTAGPKKCEPAEREAFEFFMSQWQARLERASKL